ncbi:membrane protein [Microbacterium phage BAjuniper]|nr:membrane protein [Microbacterium phage BAjuniper]
MDKHPVNPKRRRALEATIRVVDLFVYAIVFLGGVALVFLPFNAAVEQLRGYELLVVLWASFLLGGGLVGFAGRLSRYWMVETPATVAAAFGSAIYAVILGQYAFHSLAAFFTEVFVLGMLAFLVRRWLELQIFSTEPTPDWRTRLFLAWHRRTQNVVHRETS